MRQGNEFAYGFGSGWPQGRRDREEVTRLLWRGRQRDGIGRRIATAIPATGAGSSPCRWQRLKWGGKQTLRPRRRRAPTRLVQLQFQAVRQQFVIDTLRTESFRQAVDILFMVPLRELSDVGGELLSKRTRNNDMGNFPVSEGLPPRASVSNGGHI